MLKAGIYAPYTKSETTLAAVQFADWLVRCGIDVSMLSTTRIQKGVHPYWDTHVKRNTRKNIYKWAYNSTHLCWFAADLQAWEMSKVVTINSPKHYVSHFFLPGFSRWSKDADYFLSFADRVICLSQDIFSWLREFKGVEIDLSDRTWANLVSPSQVKIPRYGYLLNDQPRIMVFCPKEWEIDLPLDFLSIFDDLMCFNRGVTVTMVFDKSVPNRVRRLLKKTKKQYADRFSWKTQLNFYDLVAEARRHDWVYVAGTRYSYGSFFSLFASSTLPLIGHDIPPVGAHVGDKLNGRLVPCELSKSIVPIAEVNLNDISDVLYDVIDLPQVSIKGLQIAGNKLYANKQKSFQRFIYREFTGCDDSQT
jgi:hypothetical protein